MNTAVIRKNLAGQEDLLLGVGALTQTRNSKPYEINKVTLTAHVNSLAELDDLDTTKFLFAVLYDSGSNMATTYKFEDPDWIAYGAVVPLSTLKTTVATIADTTLVEGQRVEVDGYFVAGDGGAMTYEVVAAATGTPDYGSFLDTAGTVQLKAIFDASSLSVANWGIVPGGADLSLRWNSMVTYIKSIDGAHVLIPNGTYEVENLVASNNTAYYATSYGAVTLRVPDNGTKQIFYNPDQATTTTIDYLVFGNIIFDGNADNFDVTGPAASAVAFGGVNVFIAKDCTFRKATGYGLGFQSVPTTSLPGVQREIYLENCRFDDNGAGTNFSVDKFDGLDIKDADRVTLIGCSASNNFDKGFDLRGNTIVVTGGASYENAEEGYSLRANHNGQILPSEITLTGITSRNNGTNGISCSGAGAGLGKVRTKLDNCNIYNNAAAGIGVVSSADELLLNICNSHVNNNTDGLVITDYCEVNVSNTFFTFNTAAGVSWSGDVDISFSSCNISDNDYGIYALFGTGDCRMSSTVLLRNATQGFYSTTLQRFTQSASLDHLQGSGDIIASAAALPITDVGETYYITGSTNITSIAAPYRSRKITLLFTSSLTLVHSATLRMPNAVNLAVNNNDVLELIYNGTAWVATSYTTT